MIRTALITLIMAMTIITGCQFHAPLSSQKALNQNWEFSQAGKEQWYPATVPGCVHTDLMKNDIIEDPFYRSNEDSVQWISKKDWIYRTTFDVSKKEIEHDAIELVFEGLDTHATVKLNGEVVLKAHNMFRTFNIPVKDKLKPGKNQLEIYFRSPEAYNKEQAARVSYTLPEDERVYSRKAPYQFGWDWGPRLITSGIWRPAYLRMWNQARIDNASIRTTNIYGNKASLRADINVEAAFPLQATVTITSPDGQFSRVSQPLSLNKGSNKVSLEFEINKPRLWWCNGLGEPNLYNVDVELVTDEGADHLDEKIGVRTIELIREKDEAGSSFEFHLNGKPVFAKGANFIPLESFPSRLTQEDYENAIKDAVKANYNMLRVWGGGIYEDDAFYDLCDENGIMVWQDFMFACAMYPGDETFLKTVRHEVEDNVVRLRNHASLALWCGNNEIRTGWFDWRWQKRFGHSETDSLEIWHNYQTIFHKIIPDVLTKEDPSRNYWPSSPSYGWRHKESTTTGDNHYWGVWGGLEPFSMYRNKVSRFMSEFGFQAFPSWQTIKTFTTPEDRSLWSDVMQVHQKHLTGNKNIKTYMDRWYPIPKDFESLVYVSQVLQAEGMMDGIAALRRAKPYCMGALYWQYNDCWPVISWSSRDYYGNWKAMHYYARKVYDQLFVSPFEEDGRLKVTIVSDKLKAIAGSLKLLLYDFDGNLIRTINKETKLNPNTSEEVISLPLSELLKDASPTASVLKAEFVSDGRVLADNYHYFALPKDLKLKTPKINYSVVKNDKGYVVTVSSDVVARNVQLQIPGAKGWWSNNFFELIPGEEKTVVLETTEEIPGFEKQLKIRSLIDAF
jgi:beta-mannosidase